MTFDPTSLKPRSTLQFFFPSSTHLCLHGVFLCLRSSERQNRSSSTADKGDEYVRLFIFSLFSHNERAKKEVTRLAVRARRRVGELRRRKHLKLVFNIKCVRWSLINTRPLLFPARRGERRPFTARKVNAEGQVISHPHQDPPCRRSYHASSRHDTSVLIYGL